MQVSAISSAVAGMQRANAMMNEAATEIARDTVVSTAQPTVVPAASDDGLVAAIPNLLVARTLLAANAAVARTASEAYEATLAWVDRAS